MEDVSGQRWNRMPLVLSLAILAVKFKQEFLKQKSAITFQNVSNTRSREISDAQRRLKSWATQKCQPKILNVFRVQERNDISRIV